MTIESLEIRTCNTNSFFNRRPLRCPFSQLNSIMLELNAFKLRTLTIL